MASHTTPWVLMSLLIFSLILNLETSLGLSVNEHGGYSLIVTVRNDAKIPDNVESYVQNIKSVFQTLSGRMWTATRESFYIDQVEIIVPETWNVKTSGMKPISYGTGDIRVSTANTSPYVENPNGCGLPGNFIELPQEFFKNANSGNLGENWKVLLVQWARYRWGAFEEHGIPGDKRFPYFSRDTEAAEDEPKWVLNGCTNAQDNKLVGEYRKLDGTPCNATSDAELDPQCRFYPNPNSNSDVTSSLMHFHFMESVSEFCDATTHQKDIPTKQNLYCGNKSVMETIESSPDFMGITSKASYVPNLKTTVSTAPSKPALYLLLDSGIADKDEARILNKVFTEAGKYIGNEGSGFGPEAVLGVGEFPSKSSLLQELVPFGFLRDNREAIIDAIGNREVFTNSQLDFGKALELAAARIKSKSPSENGSILFIKTTSARSSSTFSVENEVKLALQRANIKLFAIEIVDVNQTRKNLDKLVSDTQGHALTIDLNNEPGISTDVPTWLNDHVLTNYENSPVYSRLERTVFSQAVVPDSVYSIPVLSKTQKLTFVLTTPEKLVLSRLTAGVVTAEVSITAEFTESLEWGSNRFVYTGILDTSGWVLNQVSFQFTATLPGHLTVLSDGVELPDQITVQVGTSALGNILDLENYRNHEAPFIIEAAVKQNDRPVIGAHVVATAYLYIEEYGYQEAISYELSDAPHGLDNAPGDGVYSDIIMLVGDGQYFITVTATQGNISTSQSNKYASPTTLLVPPDQNFKAPEPLEFPPGATAVSSLGSPIEVRNWRSDRYILKIEDLSFTEFPDKASAVLFNFTAPRFFDMSSFILTTPSWYRFYASTNPDLLVNLNVTDLPGGVTEAFAIDSSEPRPIAGAEVSSSQVLSLTAPTYFTVVGFCGSSLIECPSPSSNVILVDATELVESTTDDSGPEPEEEEEESKPWIKSTGGIITIVAIVLICIAAAGGGYWYLNKRRQSKQVQGGSSTNA